jgi:hypothetical protein
MILSVGVFALQSLPKSSHGRRFNPQRRKGLARAARESSRAPAASAQPFAWPDLGGYRHGTACALRLAWLGAAHTNSLFCERPERGVELKVFAQNDLGKRKSGKPLPLHAARTKAPKNVELRARQAPKRSHLLRARCMQSIGGIARFGVLRVRIQAIQHLQACGLNGA